MLRFQFQPLLSSILEHATSLSSYVRLCLYVNFGLEPFFSEDKGPFIFILKKPKKSIKVIMKPSECVL